MRRLTVFVVGTLAGLWVLSAPASAQDGDWACIYVTAVDTGVCQQNPLPQESPVPLPVPDEAKVVPDDVPRLAPLVDSVLQAVPDVKPDLPDDPASAVSGNPTSVVPGGNPVPGNPTSAVPGGSPLPVPTVPWAPPPPAPEVPYVPTGMPGTPI